MGGIVGLLNLDGSPVDEGLLRRMTEHMAFRGPDRQRVQVMTTRFWSTLLETSDESKKEEQPFTLDGRRWIGWSREWMRGRTHRRLRARTQEDRPDLRMRADPPRLLPGANSAWRTCWVTHVRCGTSSNSACFARVIISA